jgi:dUTP pyrophosphatase
MIDIAVINKSDNPLPHYQTSQSAGMDICAYLSAPVEIQPGERQLIDTGLYLALPHNYEAQIRPRSGLALKHGITVLNSPGSVVDQSWISFFYCKFW